MALSRSTDHLPHQPSPFYSTAASIELRFPATTDTPVTLDGAPVRSTCSQAALWSPASVSFPITTTTTEHTIQEADPPASVEPLVTQNDEAQRDTDEDKTTVFFAESAPAATAEIVPAIVISSVAEVERHVEPESTVAGAASSVAVPSELVQDRDGAASLIAKQEIKSPKEAAAVESTVSRQDEPRVNTEDSARISAASFVRPPASKAETQDNQQSLAAPSASAAQRGDTSRSAQENSSLSAPVQQEIVDIEMRIDPASLSLPSGSLHQSDSGRIARAPDGRDAPIVDDSMQGNQEDVEMEEAVEQAPEVDAMEVDLNVEISIGMETEDLVIETGVVMDTAETPTSTLAHITAPESLVDDVNMEGESADVEHVVTMETVETQAANNQPPAPHYAPEAVMEDVVAQSLVTEAVEGAPIAIRSPQENVPARVPDVRPVQAPVQVVQAIPSVRAVESARVVAPAQSQHAVPVGAVIPTFSTSPAVQPSQAIHAVRPAMQRPSPLATGSPRQTANPTIQPRSLAAPAVWSKRPEPQLFMPKKGTLPVATRPPSSTTSSGFKQGVRQAGSPRNEKLWNPVKKEDPTGVKTIHAAKTASRPPDHQFKVPALPARLSLTPTTRQGGTVAPLSSTNAKPHSSQAVPSAPSASHVRPAARPPVYVAMTATDADEEEFMNSTPRPPPPPAYAMPPNAAELARRDQEEVMRIMTEFRAQREADGSGNAEAGAKRG